MLRYPGHPCLCVFHARAEAQLLETARLGGELSQTVSGDFMTATDINHALGRLYAAVAEDRIPSAMPTPSPVSAAPCSAQFPPSNPNSPLAIPLTNGKNFSESELRHAEAFGAPGLGRVKPFSSTVMCRAVTGHSSG